MDVNTSIRQRLLKVEERFLLAVAAGSDALEDFNSFWTTLSHDAGITLQSSDVDDQLKSLMNATSCRIAFLAESWCQLEEVECQNKSTLMDELDALFSQSVLEDVPRQAYTLQGTSDFAATHEYDHNTISSSSLDSSLPYRDIESDVQSSVESNDAFVSINADMPDLPDFVASPGDTAKSAVRHLRQLSSSPVSRTPSLVSCSSSDESDDEDIPPEPIAGRKRSSSALNDKEDVGTSSDAPCKKIRSERRTTYSLYETNIGSFDFLGPSLLKPEITSGDSLPSKLSKSFQGSLASCIRCIPPAEPNASLLSVDISETPVSPTTLRRKRRLSDGGTDVQPFKRRRGPRASPRPQTVSDPLPITSVNYEQNFSIDRWFESNFDVPEPISISVLSPSTPVDIRLFDDWSSVNTGSQCDLSLPAWQRSIPAVDDILLPADVPLHGDLSIPTGLSPDLSSSGDDAADILKLAINSLSSATVNSSEDVVRFDFEEIPPSPPAECPAVSRQSIDVSGIIPDSTHSVNSSSEPDIFSVDGYSPSNSSVAPASRSSRSTPPPLYIAPPSFTDGVDASPLASATWDQYWDPYWDPFEELADAALQGPPPPYHRFASIWEEVKISESKVSDYTSLFSGDNSSPAEAPQCSQPTPAKLKKCEDKTGRIEAVREAAEA
ncbi:hypothetical protein SCP_0106080 [Sparassis crispa]|uniref:Mating-type protein A-alpha/beta 1 N-terminal domain-containing protein n=1 Tax=Sparassis crispa TaxID=139825 RepID=A0A401G6D0_9APHY|nr:hypothetical protein SCP_0106080 [Sparassis crispa]GBE77726.1 hypothetical protein SCP_0106080 [Sparassis crispa]